MARYSDDQRAEALTVLAANDGNYAKTKRDLESQWDSAPCRATLRKWDKREDAPETPKDESVAEKSHQKKGELADRLEEIAWKMVGKIDDDQKLEDASVTQLTTGFGTIIDKMRLLREEATEINENRDSDEHRRALDQRLERLRASGDGPERN
jgi:hypothetical protein